MNEAYWAVRPEQPEGKHSQHLFRVGGAFVAIVPKSVSLQRNRVVGLGVKEQAAEKMVDEILDLFRAFKVKRFSFHLSPCSQAEAIAGWLTRRGFEPHHAYSKLFRDTREPAPVASDLRVQRIGADEASQFAGVFERIFPTPPENLSWIAAAVGSEGFSHYLAYAGDRPVATGLLYVSGQCGWMGWAGTLTPYRRRGAHAALIAARLRRAAELGARWVACATLEPRRGRPSGSFRDLLRQGFEQVCLRPIWVWDRR
ncbi:MAG TPA: hypothetical protein VL523_07245 [Terriglobia bacterium]|nr:hypothetical protein [Terriglobia bacterium]